MILRVYSGVHVTTGCIVKYMSVQGVHCTVEYKSNSVYVLLTLVSTGVHKFTAPQNYQNFLYLL